MDCFWFGFYNFLHLLRFLLRYFLYHFRLWLYYFIFRLLLQLYFFCFRLSLWFLLNFSDGLLLFLLVVNGLHFDFFNLILTRNHRNF